MLCVPKTIHAARGFDGMTANIHCNYQFRAARKSGIVGLQPTVIASRAPHLLLEQSVMIQSKDSKNRGRASPVKSGITAKT